MTFHVITLFPEMFNSYLNESILKRAQKDKKITVKFYNPRKFSNDKHKTVDDKPYGGGPGMVMMVEPVLKAWESARFEGVLKKIFKTITMQRRKKSFKTYIFSPGGRKFTTRIAKSDSKKYTDVILICGRYEGIDSRIIEIAGAEELSIGDYVLTGGELPAMVVIDSMSRQVPGVLGKFESLEEERISSGKMYTRPEVFEYKGKEYSVPEVLMSGHHKKIDEWRSKNK
jgi:tRNA (guanine37-N1)-methyltransferase